MEGIVKRSFNLNLNVMKVIGLYPLDKYPRFYKLYAYFMYSLAVIPASVLGFLEIFFKEDNSEESYDDPASFVIILLSPKLFSILANGYNIRKCIHYFDVELVTTFNDENLEIINNCVMICRRNSTVFFAGCVLSIVGWVAKLFFREDMHQLPLDVWFPLKSQNTPLYYCLYFSLVLGRYIHQDSFNFFKHFLRIFSSCLRWTCLCSNWSFNCRLDLSSYGTAWGSQRKSATSRRSCR